VSEFLTWMEDNIRWHYCALILCCSGTNIMARWNTTNNPIPLVKYPVYVTQKVWTTSTPVTLNGSNLNIWTM
jgi:hypothetical protein